MLETNKSPLHAHLSIYIFRFLIFKSYSKHTYVKTKINKFSMTLPLLIHNLPFYSNKNSNLKNN